MTRKYEFPERKWGKDNSSKTSLSIVIKDDGSIVFDGIDIGPDVEANAPGADSDYEYSVTVDPKFHNELLIELLKRFEDEVAFKDWLKEKNIPFEFWSY